ncbi:MAG: hypothetical protein AUH85_13260 [Chloroflexi bacterium 13_1_40CM_4_68_4]|nr:MAG: hypothetical protein AUH85_13260 [Chloroflexi bacterium 13_1_40CM_4_68_4]
MTAEAALARPGEIDAIWREHAVPGVAVGMIADGEEWIHGFGVTNVTADCIRVPLLGLLASAAIGTWISGWSAPRALGPRFASIFLSSVCASGAAALTYATLVRIFAESVLWGLLW